MAVKTFKDLVNNVICLRVIMGLPIHIASFGCSFEAFRKGQVTSLSVIFDSIGLIGQSNLRCFSAAVSIVCFVSSD